MNHLNNTTTKPLNQNKMGEICCPNCGESENIHFNIDYSSFGMLDVSEYLCNECGIFFTSKKIKSE